MSTVDIAFTTLAVMGFIALVAALLVVEETYLKEEEKRKVKDAVESLLKLSEESPAPHPESWGKWEHVKF